MNEAIVRYRYKPATMDALAWLSDRGYKAVKAIDIRAKKTNNVIGREIHFRKPECSTEYLMTVYN